MIDAGQPVSKASPWKAVWALLRVAISIGAIGYFAFNVHWADLSGRLEKASPSLMIEACLCLGVAYIFSGIRWWYLLRVQSIYIALYPVVVLTFIGQFFNTFMLGAVGGDLVRALYVARSVPRQKTHATLSILMDRIAGLFILLLGSVLSIAFQYHALMASGDTRRLSLALALVLTGFLVAGSLLAFFPFERAPDPVRALWRRVPLRHLPELLLGGFRAHRLHFSETLLGLAAGIALTLMIVLAGVFLGNAIHLSVTYIEMLQILTVAICVTSLPISIGGHGVREAIFVFLFAAFGIINAGPGTPGTDAALLFSICFFALSSVWSVAGGLLYLGFKPRWLLPSQE
jgi:uncharacterized membrane protein YbhN (UPF0104 family)